jgi:hypothetical protein
MSDAALYLAFKSDSFQLSAQSSQPDDRRDCQARDMAQP